MHVNVDTISLEKIKMVNHFLGKSNLENWKGFEQK